MTVSAPIVSARPHLEAFFARVDPSDAVRNGWRPLILPRLASDVPVS